MVSLRVSTASANAWKSSHWKEEAKKKQLEHIDFKPFTS
jgi:hypothetical protein